LLESSGSSSKSSHDEQSEGSQACVEVCFTFYLIPKYIGILREKDVDYSTSAVQVLVNDDRQEDLKNVHKFITNQQLVKDELHEGFFKTLNKK